MSDNNRGVSRRNPTYFTPIDTHIHKRAENRADSLLQAARWQTTWRFALKAQLASIALLSVSSWLQLA